MDLLVFGFFVTVFLVTCSYEKRQKTKTYQANGRAVLEAARATDKREVRRARIG